MQTEAMTRLMMLCSDHLITDLRNQKPFNTRSQSTRRREVRRRSDLPKAIQKRLGFKCH